MAAVLPQKRILLFTGSGKGKTTAALGVALRAWGHGYRVLVVQFIKQDQTTGEYRAIERLPSMKIVTVGRGFLPATDSEKLAEHARAAKEGLILAQQLVNDERWDVVVLDEIVYAVARGLLSEEEVIEKVNSMPDGTTVILTGRGATDGLIAVADTVTEMVERKHILRSGVKAQKGVEY